MGKQKRLLTTAEFIARAQAVHGDRYDYSRAEYRGRQVPIEVICRTHGSFFPRPNNHLSAGSGCPACNPLKPTNLEVFLARAAAAHGDRYDYGRVVYQGVQKPVEILCPDHGPFWQIPLSHTQGRGCPTCGAAKCVRRKDTAWFIARAREVHGERYDYREVTYQRAATPVTIHCPEHGPFTQVAAYHLAGNGCPACAGVKPIDRDAFLVRAHAAHGDRYDYGQMDYRGWLAPVTILCREHGPFDQVPKTHAQGHGCPACAGLMPLTWERFLARAREVHGDRYDYSQVRLVNVMTPVTIICPEHGAFEQRPQDHLNQGHGCAACAGRRPVDYAEFVRRARAVHGARYTYAEKDYQAYKQPTIVLCPEHGPFSVLPQNHTDRQSGCPQCASLRTSSRDEEAIAAWVAGLGVRVLRNERQVLDGPELDIYLPEHKLGIEYNGSYWHRDALLKNRRHHEYKVIAAERAGLRVLTIWDFDWHQRQPLVQRWVRHALGLSDLPKVHARACTLQPVAPAEAYGFYDQYHIQGGVRRHALHLGLYQDAALVACMSFLQGGSRRGRFGADEWELIRYATSAQVRGGASRLFQAFCRQVAPQQVWSFSDRQHFAGSLYPTLGFVLDGRVAADYRVVDKRTLRVWPKAAWQRRFIPQRLTELGLPVDFDPASDPRSEQQMQDQAGVLRIYDAGKLRWRWTAETTTPGEPGAASELV